MIQTVSKVGLPVDEVLEIKKNRIEPDNISDGSGNGMKRISIVTGIHGDELEGQYVCYELARRIKEEKENLTGIVDIYPAMNPLGIWKGETKEPRKAIISEGADDVAYLNASRSGVFVPCVKHWEELNKGEVIGQIIDPLKGEVVDEIISPIDGILFTIREYPIVDEGSLIGRLLRKEVYKA